MSANYRSSFVARVRSRPSSAVYHPPRWKPWLESSLEKIDEYAKSLAGVPNVETDLERILPLREACQEDDYFFLAVHQVYCLTVLKRLADPALVGSPEDVVAAMPHLDLIFRTSGGAISLPVIEWLSQFPAPIDEMEGRHKLAVERMPEFLKRLPLQWPRLVVQCKERGYPPLHQELDVMFRTRSLNLQSTMFWIIVDLMGLPPHRYKEMYQIHRWDMYVSYYLSDRLATARLSIDYEVEAFNQHTVAMFRGACPIKGHLESRECGFLPGRKRRPPAAPGARSNAPQASSSQGRRTAPRVAQPRAPRASSGPVAGTSRKRPQEPSSGPGKQTTSDVIVVVSSESEGEAGANPSGPRPTEPTPADIPPSSVPAGDSFPPPAPPEVEDPAWSTLESMDQLLDPSGEGSAAPH